MGSRRRFRYVDPAGRAIEDDSKVERIDELRIPPAWTDVWISPNPRAKLQATGVDRAGRRQYLYHPEYRARQEQAKYDRLVRFAERLPKLRATMGEHMDLDPTDPRRVCAVAIRLINLTWFRVGSDRYAKHSRTFGVTTLTRRHVRVRGERVTFRFRAKNRSMVRTTLVDSELAETIKGLLASPGARVFRYERDGERCNLSGAVLNEYIGEHLGDEFTAKDFRTWGGTLTAAVLLAEHGRRRDRSRGSACGRGGDAPRRRTARKYSRGRASLLRQPGGDRAVSRRAHDRRFSATPFADRWSTRYRSRSRRAGTAQPAAILADS